MFRVFVAALALAVCAQANVRQWKHKGLEFSGRLTMDSIPSDFCGEPDVAAYAGYYDISGSKSASYYYYLGAAREDADNAPLVMWLTGGPGCSSLLAMFSENGPCSVNERGTGTVNNPYAWNTKANVMWVDQPAGVGFSYGSFRDYVTDEDGVGEDLYQFLQAFTEANPSMMKNGFYIFGESYGGHFVPAIASRIYQGNKAGEGVNIPLAGIGIGNGLTNPTIQYQYYPQMANNNTYGVKAVSEEQYQSMVDALPACQNLAEKCQEDVDQCSSAYNYCNTKETTPYYNTGLNPYDITKPCGDSSLCYDFTNIDTFLNRDSTKNTMHVSSKANAWTECNNFVNAMFSSDWMQEQEQKIIPLLEDGIPALIYVGDKDFICNWYGNQAWTLALDWSGKRQFNAAEVKPYIANGKEAGMGRTANGFTFLRVYEAGHMVPMDQPAVSLDMLNKFLAGESLV